MFLILPKYRASTPSDLWPGITPTPWLWGPQRILGRWSCEELHRGSPSADLSSSRPRADMKAGSRGGRSMLRSTSLEQVPGGAGPVPAPLLWRLFLEVALERLSWQETMSLSTTINFHLQPAPFLSGPRLFKDLDFFEIV